MSSQILVIGAEIHIHGCRVCRLVWPTPAVGCRLDSTIFSQASGNQTIKQSNNFNGCFQIGAFNADGGLQVGLFNAASDYGERSAFQVGLLNYNPHGLAKWLPIFNFSLGRK